MDFVSFSVINSRGYLMKFCMEQHKADIMIERLINMNNCKVIIDGIKRK